ncbi:hypothetical protein GALMADRAFT_232317 [Galerina marginata CBS 339.88]|uniref:Uncharacterized protein n=1 Tax=Galerina marginata (strain CBS 339.88) TaxID=685588 RepID=A0A067SJK0_GALM3|nr:hypothetical protein GALMADRAFT_232317 [Galerina marginata CBS 339.88]
MSRAGLVSLMLFFLSVSLVVSAPVPERVLSLAERFDDLNYDNDFVARSLDVLVDRELDIAGADFETREYLDMFDREFPMDDEEYILKRELSTLDAREFDDLEEEYTKRDDSDVHVLYRRKSIFTKIKNAFKKVGSGIKKGFQKVGSGLKTGFKKVGGFIKKTVAKVAKVYLKVAAAVATVAAKVVKFIPGVGNGISLALKGYAYGANKASDKIHANIGKLSKFTNGLNYVINPMGSVGKAAGKHGGKAGKIASSLLF